VKRPLTAAVLTPFTRNLLVVSVTRGHAPVQVRRGLFKCLRCQKCAPLDHVELRTTAALVLHPCSERAS
jgi:hypothetical protein